MIYFIWLSESLKLVLYLLSLFWKTVFQSVQAVYQPRWSYMQAEMLSFSVAVGNLSTGGLACREQLEVIQLVKWLLWNSQSVTEIVLCCVSSHPPLLTCCHHTVRLLDFLNASRSCTDCTQKRYATQCASKHKWRNENCLPNSKVLNRSKHLKTLSGPKESKGNTSLGYCDPAISQEKTGDWA